MNSKVCPPCPNEHPSQNMGCNALNLPLPNPQSKVPTLVDQAQQNSQHGSKISQSFSKNNEIFQAQPNQEIIAGQSKNLNVLSKRTTILEGNMQVDMSKASAGLQG